MQVHETVQDRFFSQDLTIVLEYIYKKLEGKTGIIYVSNRYIYKFISI